MIQIREAGVLRPATAGVPQGEIPVVWFSARQHWEPTANKNLQLPDGRIVSLDFAETISRGEGGWRFGMPVESLIPWRRLREAARITPKTATGLIRAAKRQGADQAFWYGSLEPVPLHACVIERLDADTWVNAD
jgi:hypothetical protein